MEIDIGVSIGIDLGTTYSSISYFDNNSRESVLISSGSDVTSFASCIAITKYGQNDLSYTFGKEAKDKGGPFVLYDAKRLVGKSIDQYEQMGSEKDCWTFEVTEDICGNAVMKIPNPIDTERTMNFYPEEVSAMVLMELMKLTRTKIGELVPIGNVVVTIPVDFTPEQRNATVRACNIAGIKNVELINEPSAAIVEYKRYIEKDGRKKIKEGTKILVIDFGGGTLDVCCCQIGRKSIGERNETNIEVLATGGDQDLGGNNFDEVVKDLIIEKIEELFPEAMALLKITKKDTPKIKNMKKRRLWKIMTQAEKTKIALSENFTTQIDLGELLGDDFSEDSITITREEFDGKCDELISRFEDCVQRILSKAKMEKSKIDLVLPIGGTCNIRIVREIIRKMFPDEKKRAHSLFNSLSAVSKGAAYQAFIHQTNETRKNKIVEERLPYGVGFEIVDAKTNEKIIYYHVKEGEKLPSANKTATYMLAEDNLTEAVFPLYTGNGKKTTDKGMRYQGELKIKIPPNTMKNDFKMSVTMDISESGLIHVEVTKEKDRKYLGKLDCVLGMNLLESEIYNMQRHILQFIK